MKDMGRFKFLYADLWMWQIPATRRFHFIRLMRWKNEVGHKVDDCTYNIDLHEVDLDVLPTDEMRRAKESCGISDFDSTPATVAEACAFYGLYAPIDSQSTNNWQIAFRLFARRSLEVAARPAILDELIVNRIGSTAREIMVGDINSALRRGVEKGDEQAILVAKIQGVI